MYDKMELGTRLASIEGHVRGIRKMVEDERYCVDVLKQTYAVERALQKLGAELLRGHLSSCVAGGFKVGPGDQVSEELVDIFEIARR
ncbi:MAG TPA: metal-sensitive transcriptional regulator [Candidatus Limnocylindria bacterium]|nr:metal-sensitive transcriptional regulator [Candidatus Limnocylindria bacterium]